MKLYKPLDIANWFLLKESMTHKKIQKLCYYAQAWSYALRNRPIIDTWFEAWVHGPVSPDIYHEFKGHNWETIEPITQTRPAIDKEDADLLESVWETYGNLTGNALEVLTHSEPPWQNARRGHTHDQHSNNKISSKDMREYYLSIYAGGEE